LNGNNVIDLGDGEVAVANANAIWYSDTLPPVPDTGFKPGVFTDIPKQSVENQYNQFSDVWMEIPALGVMTDIVGVPLDEDTWDVTWLVSQVGWLEGSAFPSYSGNSIVTAHVYLPSGAPGPFVNLNQLGWDDQIIVHAFGEQYIYKVRATSIIQPDDPRATRHEEYPWMTLLTCKGYNELTDSYDYRVMVRAVLIDKTQDY